MVLWLRAVASRSKSQGLREGAPPQKWGASPSWWGWGPRGGRLGPRSSKAKLRHRRQGITSAGLRLQICLLRNGELRGCCKLRGCKLRAPGAGCRPGRPVRKHHLCKHGREDGSGLLNGPSPKERMSKRLCDSAIIAWARELAAAASVCAPVGFVRRACAFWEPGRLLCQHTKMKNYFCYASPCLFFLFAGRAGPNWRLRGPLLRIWA